MMNLGGLDGSVTTLGGKIKLTGKAAGLARRAVYAVSESSFYTVFHSARDDLSPAGSFYDGTSICG